MASVIDERAPATVSRPLGPARRRYGEDLIKGALFLCAMVSVATTAGILIALLQPTREFFADVSPTAFFTGRDWSPLFSPPSFGVRPLITATIVVTGVALVICLPLGLGAAVFLSEYAGQRLRRWLKPLLEVLAGIPTVVYGFFALTFVTPQLQRFWFLPGDPPGIFNGLAAGLVMGIMILPTVASLSEDAMAAVPETLRAGAFALGSSRRQVATKIVVPAALSGIMASFVLAVSRALGETMIVLIAAGNQPNLTFDPTEPMQTMTSFIGAAGLGDQAKGTTGYKTIFAVGATLFVATFIMNMISIRLVRRFREVYE
ncbi:MAG: phosphate transport system permease protein [Actinomycetota bacterium]|jgi:phosphate transport system permease protein